MKKIYLLITLLSLLNSAKAQFLKAYYPTGKKITYKWNTLNDLYDSLNVFKPEMYHCKDGYVLFKKFTKKPVAILFEDKVYLERIPAMVNSYSYKYANYLLSYSYYSDLKRAQSEQILTTHFITETFGKPDILKVNESGDTVKIFKDFNLSITGNGLPTEINVLNYQAIEKNKLMIGAFNVTGEDYTIGFNIVLHNLSPKVVKYVYITVTAYNDVDDVVGKKTVTGVGPIVSNDYSSYDFDNIIYSRVASSLKINNLRILYMDGTQKIIPSNEINSIKFYDWEKEGQKEI